MECHGYSGKSPYNRVAASTLSGEKYLTRCLRNRVQATQGLFRLRKDAKSIFLSCSRSPKTEPRELTRIYRYEGNLKQSCALLAICQSQTSMLMRALKPAKSERSGRSALAAMVMRSSSCILSAVRWLWIGEHLSRCPPSRAAYRIPGRHHTMVHTGIGLRRSHVRRAMILAS